MASNSVKFTMATLDAISVLSEFESRTTDEIVNACMLLIRESGGEVYDKRDSPAREELIKQGLVDSTINLLHYAIGKMDMYLELPADLEQLMANTLILLKNLLREKDGNLKLFSEEFIENVLRILHRNYRSSLICVGSFSVIWSLASRLEQAKLMSKRILRVVLDSVRFHLDNLLVVKTALGAMLAFSRAAVSDSRIENILREIFRRHIKDAEVNELCVRVLKESLVCSQEETRFIIRLTPSIIVPALSYVAKESIINHIMKILQKLVLSLEVSQELKTFLTRSGLREALAKFVDQAPDGSNKSTAIQVLQTIAPDQVIDTEEEEITELCLMQNYQISSALTTGCALNGKFTLASCSDGFRLFDSFSGYLLKYNDYVRDCTCCAFSPHGDLFVIGTKLGKIVVFKTSTCTVFAEFTYQLEEIWNVNFDGNDSIIFGFGGGDMSCSRVWNIRRNEVEDIISADRINRCGANFISVHHQENSTTTSIWNLREEIVVELLNDTTQNERVHSVAICDKYALTSNLGSQKVTCWELSEGFPLHHFVFNNFGGEIESLQLSQNGVVCLAVSYESGEAVCCSLSTGKVLQKICLEGVTHEVLSKDGTYVLFALEDGGLVLYDLFREDRLRLLTLCSLKQNNAPPVDILKKVKSFLL